MIINYNNYIKENNLNDVHTLLYKLIQDINLKFYKRILVLGNSNQYYTSIFYKNDFGDQFTIYEFKKTNKRIILNNVSFYNEHEFIEFINKNIILQYMSLRYNENKLVCVDNISIDEFINKYCFLKRNKDMFIRDLKNKVLSIDITEKYDYLIKANNFDLI